MADIRYIDDDFVAVRAQPTTGARRIVTLAFGDQVHVLGEQDGWTQVRVLEYFSRPFRGWVRGRLPVRDTGVLRLSMVDVQQGDGLVLETPGGQIVLIDGGDNKLFARHVAARYRHRAATPEKPLDVAAILITHGDADHFDGLNDIARSEELPDYQKHKRLAIHPRRVFHNGLVKRPYRDAKGKRLKDTELFGPTTEHEGRLYALDLKGELRGLPAAELNRPFEHWVKSLDHWSTRGPIDVQRVAFGMDESALFGFLADERVGVEILGPFEARVPHPETGEDVAALPFFHAPRLSAEQALESDSETPGTPSASHTVNGHSITLRITFGNVRFLLTGDLNDEAMRALRANVPLEKLEAEIVKAPHHGSDDFDLDTLRAVRPVVAIVSSGDESEAKEYIHPRATLMAALGASMRGKGLVFSTELAAFFSAKAECYTRDDLAAYFAERHDETFTGEDLRQLFTGVPRPEDPKGLFYGFERTNFGIVHLRTDGERVLAFTHSGKEGVNEAYRFHVTVEDGEHRVAFRNAVTTR